MLECVSVWLATLPTNRLECKEFAPLSVRTTLSPNKSHAKCPSSHWQSSAGMENEHRPTVHIHPHVATNACWQQETCTNPALLPHGMERTKGGDIMTKRLHWMNEAGDVRMRIQSYPKRHFRNRDIYKLFCTKFRPSLLRSRKYLIIEHYEIEWKEVAMNALPWSWALCENMCFRWIWEPFNVSCFISICH